MSWRSDWSECVDGFYSAAKMIARPMSSLNFPDSEKLYKDGTKVAPGKTGDRALFIEHPSDKSNCVNLKNVKSTELPWADTDKVPDSITGLYLREFFLQAFVAGLHDPSLRPSANDWETALIKTVDLIQPCQNPDCAQKWYVFDNSMQPRCPFCGTLSRENSRF
jgi:hypothetical protein